MSLKNYKILAIDTSTNGCSAALQFENTLLTRYESKPREHTRLLLPMINSLLEEAGLVLNDLDVMACTCGPGSFTGVRIGTSVIQGLSMGLNKPVILVSTLRAVAQAAYRLAGVSHVFASLDARMQEVYWGLFALDDNGIMQAQSAEMLADPKQINLPSGTWVARQDAPDAQDVVRIAQFEYALGHFAWALDVQAVYLRNPAFAAIAASAGKAS